MPTARTSIAAALSPATAMISAAIATTTAIPTTMISTTMVPIRIMLSKTITTKVCLKTGKTKHRFGKTKILIRCRSWTNHIIQSL